MKTFDYKQIRGENNFFLIRLETNGDFLYFIMSPIYEEVSRIKNAKNLVKPSFSYYKSFNSLTNIKTNDINVLALQGANIQLADKDNEKRQVDAEVIIIDKRISEEDCIIMFDSIDSDENKGSSLFEMVKKLEDFYGIVWKTQRELQIGLIGELLLIKKHPKYTEELIKGWHEDNMGGKTFKSKSDFVLNDSENKIKSIEVKTTTSIDNIFSLKNDQIINNINDYFCAVKIFEDRNGKTVLDYIEWFKEVYKGLPNDFTDWLYKIEQTLDTRKLLRINEELTKIKFIKINNIPRIESSSEDIFEISFKINLFKIDGEDIEEIFK